MLDEVAQGGAGAGHRALRKVLEMQRCLRRRWSSKCEGPWGGARLLFPEDTALCCPQVPLEGECVKDVNIK